MSENSNIEWTDHTFNPWIGCTKVSPGCLNCYAETLDIRRFSKTLGAATKEIPVSHWGKGKPRHRTSVATWKQPLKWNRDAGALEEAWLLHIELCSQSGVDFESASQDWIFRGMAPWHRPRVFCASLADWLDWEVPIEWLADLLALIRATPNLDWQLLTKRPENWRPAIESICAEIYSFYDDADTAEISWLTSWLEGTPPHNVWLGTTAEDQARADDRIPALLEIPAKIRFLSCEPLLEPLDLDSNKGGTRWIGGQRGCHGTHQGTGSPDCPREQHHHHDERCKPGIDWIITGGESGTGCRPFHPDWARDLGDQCKAAGTPFFMKQMGGPAKPFAPIPADLLIRQFPDTFHHSHSRN